MPGTSLGTALVTGAAKRIGRVIALDLAQRGWAVAVHCHRSLSEAESLVSDLQADGRRAAVVQADLADEDETADLVDRTARALGPVTCLVNNASVFENDHWDSVTRLSWDRHMQVNTRAPFVLSAAVAAQVPEGAHAAIVNILDQRVWNLTPHFMSYTVSKVALWALTRQMALALAPRIRVNAVGPGPTMPSPRQSDAQFARQWSMMPLAQRVEPQEIADAVRFILDAPSMTGQMICVDGGQHLGWCQPQPAVQAIEE
ncbi:MAG: SDR family oxidoreductase [Rhodospirillales bacterium]|nr:SDR family oxidoreductase [Rhodospirillales bacterium]